MFLLTILIKVIFIYYENVYILMSKEYIIKKEVNAFKCLRCNHEWIPRVSMQELEGIIKDKPRICPSCKSPYWDIPRKDKKEDKT